MRDIFEAIQLGDSLTIPTINPKIVDAIIPKIAIIKCLKCQCKTLLCKLFYLSQNLRNGLNPILNGATSSKKFELVCIPRSDKIKHGCLIN